MGTKSKTHDLILVRTRHEWGVIIRKKRRQLEMSQGTLAKELGCSIVNIHYVEKGLYSLSEGKLLLVQKILEIKDDLGIYYTPEKVDNWLKVAVDSLVKSKENV